MERPLKSFDQTFNICLDIGVSPPATLPVSSVNGGSLGVRAFAPGPYTPAVGGGLSGETVHPISRGLPRVCASCFCTTAMKESAVTTRVICPDTAFLSLLVSDLSAPYRSTHPQGFTHSASRPFSGSFDGSG